MSWLPVVSSHLLFAVEWVVNGEQPIPPHHGADNTVESVLYAVTGLSLLTFVPALVVSGAVMVAVQRPGADRPLPLVFLPLVAWVMALVVLMMDPVGAMYFFMD